MSVLLFANSPMLVIGVEAAATLGTAAVTALIGGSKVIVSYLRERDTARDKADATREQAYIEKLTRELNDRTDLATRFSDEISRIESERREMSKALIEINRETSSVLAQTEMALRSLSRQISQMVGHHGKPDPETHRRE